MLKVSDKNREDISCGKRLQISKEALLELFVKEKNEVANTQLTIVTRIALPNDWTAREIYWNPTRRVFELIILSKGFSSVKPGMEYPLLSTEEETLIEKRRWECLERKENMQITVREKEREPAKKIEKINEMRLDDIIGDFAWDAMISGAETLRKWLRTTKLCTSCSECIEEAITKYQEEIRILKNDKGE